MEFKSLKDLIRIVENSLAVQFYGISGQTNVLRKTVLKVLASVLGGVLYMLSLVEKRIWKNRFVYSCDVAALEGFGTEYGVPHKAPMKASGCLRVTLEDGVESVTIQQGTVIVDAATSTLEYEVAATSAITAELNGLPVRALNPGKESNLDEGVGMSFRDGEVTGVSSLESYDVGGGVLFYVEIDGDVQEWGETAEDYRARLINRIQNPPNGGSGNDYWRMATRFQFVTDAVVVENQPNTNSVSVAIANYNSENIAIADQNQLDEVTAYMTDDVRRHVCADVRVFSVTPVPVEITAYITPFNDSVKESVSAAIRQYLRTVKPGMTVSFDELTQVARANSIAGSFVVSTVKKSGSVVSSLSFTLDFDDDPVVAEVAKCSFVLLDGTT